MTLSTTFEALVYARAQRLLTIKQLSLRYGEKTILRDVNLHVDNITRPNMHQGQVVALLGLSGSGKTQLFRCIAGLQQPTSGTVTLRGSAQAVQAGEVGVVQQAYPLLQHRTVWGNLMLTLRKHGVNRATATEKANHLLAHFGISDKRDSYPLELSGGQRQRVAIIQQLLCAQHFLLMDEPFSGLDVMAKARVFDTIRAVSTEHEENTLIFTTHDLDAAVALADEIWVLGREADQPGATIVKRLDLAAMGLAWQPGIERHPRYFQTILELRELFKTL